MPLENAIETALAVLATLFAGATLFLLGHGAWLRAHRRTTLSRLAAGRAALNVLLLEPGGAGGNLRALRRLPPALQTRLVLELSRSVSGTTRGALGRVARELGVEQRAREELDSRWWWRRLHAARALQRLAVEGRPFLALLGDPHPAVRAQAAEWAGDHPDPEVAGALLERLGRADSLSRFAVQDSLLRLGSAAVDPLARHLAAGRGRELLPALEVAVALAQPPLAAPAAALCRSPHPAVRTLAAQLLGAVGGREGVEALVSLLSDPEPRARAAAARALGRTGHWPAAAAVARLLRDADWEVRRAAGLALRGLGSPGELMLRRCRDHADPLAADVARLVLDLPPGVEVAR